MAVTPLVELAPGMFLKCDYELPTGSFKDRGAAIMIGAAAHLGVGSVVVDSSGNAGKAVAAHAAAAGMGCTVYVPAGTDRAKVEAMAGFGARVVEVPGDRRAAAAAAQGALGSPPGSEVAPLYASHVHQPLFHHGVKTLAFELWEQVAAIENATVVVPAGNGTLVLGLWLGFGELVAVGRLARRPELVAVQAERCAPLTGRPVADGPSTAATGIAIPDPPRAGQVRAAVMASGGRVVTVGEDAIGAARADLTDRGLPVEPTGAVGWAAVRALPARPGPVIVVLTGH